MTKNRYTIKELADELNVTKPGIRKLMSETFRKQYTETSGNKILINSAGARIIRKHFRYNKQSQNSQTKAKTENSYQKLSKTVSSNEQIKVISTQQETIEMLREELKAKNQQLSNMQKLMDQNQQLLLNTQAENKTLLALTHQDNSQKTVKDAEYKETEGKTASNQDKQTQQKNDQEILDNLNGKKKSWWKRWF
ncbi:hypothetical protein [Limosilactobacillus rudii]|uniref:hypothetical protein n=1 Tax=Limosilactobacillus rudii TaxID=2759755 RepID=UPI0015FD2EE3|nr:hypothetical protein [Limosilactobacillus rudii]MBB1078305.1 hypothetical protein [Limosilactobacillus rudii]